MHRVPLIIGSLALLEVVQGVQKNWPLDIAITLLLGQPHLRVLADQVSDPRQIHPLRLVAGPDE